MLRQSAVALGPMLQVSQKNVYDILSVPDPQAEDSFGGMRREASFFSNTPPKFLGASRKFPSSTWLSGDENLDFSPTAGLMARSPPTSRGGLEFEPFRLSDLSPPQTSASKDTGSDDRQSSSSSGGFSRQKSAPIGIPIQWSSRAASDAPAAVMSTSRQLSEKSSRFGTPEEDLPGSEGDEMATSPPEMISRSQLKVEIGQLAGEMMDRVSDSEKEETQGGPLSAPPARIQVNTQTSFSKDEGSQEALVSERAKSAELEGWLEEKRKEAEKSERELQEEKGRMKELSLRLESLEKELERAKENGARTAELDEVKEKCTMLEKDMERRRKEEERLRGICMQQKDIMESSLRACSADLKELKDALITCTKDNEESVVKCKELVERSGEKLEANLQESVSGAQDAVIKLQREEWDREKDALLLNIQNERSRTLAAQKQVEDYEALMREKEDVVSVLREEMGEKDEKWRRTLEDSKSEIIKQLTIEHELQLDALREGWRNELLEKESTESQLRESLKEKSEVIGQLRKEQDLLVASQYDRDIQHPSVDLETLRREQETEMKQLRMDMEKEYKDKLHFLTKGMEDKHAALLERCQKEKEVELRMLRDEQKKELERVTLRPNEASQPALVSPSHAGQTQQSVTENQMSASAVVCGDFEGIGGNLMAASAMGSVSSPSEEAELERIVERMSESVMPVAGPSTPPGESSLDVQELGVQTRLRMKEMKQMITVMDMREGDTVLVTYSDHYENYVLFSTGPTLYFPKESSLKKMGLHLGRVPPVGAGGEASGPRRPQTWTIARVSGKPEFCQIKKEANRYKLPMQTKFFRVEVDGIQS